MSCQCNISTPTTWLTSTRPVAPLHPLPGSSCVCPRHLPDDGRRKPGDDRRCGHLRSHAPDAGARHGRAAVGSSSWKTTPYRGPDGRWYHPSACCSRSRNIPFYGAGRLASSLPPLRRASPVMVTKATVALGNAAAAALCVWVVWWLAWSVTGRARAHRQPGRAPGGVRHVAVGRTASSASTSHSPHAWSPWRPYASTRAFECRTARWAWAAGTACGLALLTRA